MAVRMTQHILLTALRNKATRLRIDSVRATSEAGSGHPTSCCSAADLVAALFFSVMRYDPKNPKNPNNDRFILSKGHAAPLLYAAWAEAGLVPKEDLLKFALWSPTWTVTRRPVCRSWMWRPVRWDKASRRESAWR